MENENNTTPAKGHFVYIVKCHDGSLYTGYATNVEERITTHNAGKGAKYTRSRRPVVLQACWSFPSKSEALRAEYALKRLPRSQKLRLIAQHTRELSSPPGRFPLSLPANLS